MAALGLAVAMPPCVAQTYPSKSVRIIAGFPPGGAADADDTKARMDAMGAEPAYLLPEEFAKLIRAETEKWAKIVKATGAQAD